MKSGFPVQSSTKRDSSKAEWCAPRLSEHGNFEKLTLGSGPGKADLGHGNFGHLNPPRVGS